MNDFFKEALKEDEEVLWSGQCEKFETLDETHKKGYVTKAIITAIVCIGLVALFIAKNVENITVLILLVAVCGFWVLISNFSDAKKLRKLKYAVTNHRILVYINDAFKSTRFSDIDSVSERKDKDGHTSFLFGAEAQTLKNNQLRGIAALGIKAKSDTSPCERFVIYAVEDPQGFKAAVSKYLQF